MPKSKKSQKLGKIGGFAMGVKFGMEEGPEVPSSMPNFTPIGATCRNVLPNFTPINATCRPCGAKNLKIGL